jgi:hypothetical protein
MKQILSSNDRAALSYAMGKAIDAGVELEQLLVAVETLWDRGIQSEAILPLKIRDALAYEISRAKDPGGTALLAPFVKNQERKQSNHFLVNSRRLFLREVRAIWGKTVEAKKTFRELWEEFDN